MQKATVGRVVHFFPATTDALYRSGEPLAATIVRVWSDTCVNLALFDGEANLHKRTSVLLYREDYVRPEDGYASWPARESVTLEAKLDSSTGEHPLPPVSDAALEQQIREVGANVAPRVASEDIDALCDDLMIHTHHFPGTTTTIAVAMLPDGFVVATGHSACISPANFKRHIGEQIASDNARAAARAKLWELEGYVLRSSLVSPFASAAAVS